MKKVILIALSLAVLVTLIVPAVAMAKGPDGQSGKSNAGHVYLYEKDTDWAIVDGGAMGKFNYRLSGTGEDTMVAGVFNGKGLDAGVEYALIYYPEPANWSGGGADVVCLGVGTANKAGNVHIAGKGTIGAPDEQPNADSPSDGDKIWLVLADDLNDDASMLEAWNPSEYLFENDLINVP